MGLDQLAKLGEFVGGIFVVISLAYVAHQVRQNTRSLRTENYARGGLDRLVALAPRHPDLWATKPAPFSADFQLFGDEMIRSHRIDPAVLPGWHGFVAGEGMTPPAIPADPELPPPGAHAAATAPEDP